mgnify:CR=1 FL=1
MEQQSEVEKVIAVQVDNVRASGGDAEIEVLGKDRWEEVRRRKAEGATTSAIARETGLDRKTVRRCG